MNDIVKELLDVTKSIRITRNKLVSVGMNDDLLSEEINRLDYMILDLLEIPKNSSEYCRDYDCETLYEYYEYKLTKDEVIAKLKA